MSYDRFFADAIAQLRMSGVTACSRIWSGSPAPHAIWHSAQGPGDVVI